MFPLIRITLLIPLSPLPFNVSIACFFEGVKGVRNSRFGIPGGNARNGEIMALKVRIFSMLGAPLGGLDTTNIQDIVLSPKLCFIYVITN